MALMPLAWEEFSCSQVKYQHLSIHVTLDLLSPSQIIQRQHQPETSFHSGSAFGSLRVSYCLERPIVDLIIVDTLFSFEYPYFPRNDPGDPYFHSTESCTKRIPKCPASSRPNSPSLPFQLQGRLRKPLPPYHRHMSTRAQAPTPFPHSYFQSPKKYANPINPHSHHRLHHPFPPSLSFSLAPIIPPSSCSAAPSPTQNLTDQLLLRNKSTKNPAAGRARASINNPRLAPPSLHRPLTPFCSSLLR